MFLLLPATKVNVELIESLTADVIGCSSIIINDLRRKRMANYDFDWDAALQVHLFLIKMSIQP